jgi:hypothetical protein
MYQTHVQERQKGVVQVSVLNTQVIIYLQHISAQVAIECTCDMRWHAPHDSLPRR